MLSLRAALKSNPSSAKQWISQMRRPELSTTKNLLVGILKRPSLLMFSNYLDVKLAKCDVFSANKSPFSKAESRSSQGKKIGWAGRELGKEGLAASSLCSKVFLSLAFRFEALWASRSAQLCSVSSSHLQKKLNTQKTSEVSCLRCRRRRRVETPISV